MNEQMIIVGIDPGQTGGIAVLCGDHKAVWPMPVYKAGKDHVLDVQLFINMIKHNPLLDSEPNRIIYLEKAQAMPKQGSVSTFKYGRHYGELTGIIRTLQIPLVEVHPRTWHTAICKGCSGKPKERALMTARNLFPDVELKVSERSRKPHEGIIDALLIAEYGTRE